MNFQRSLAAKARLSVPSGGASVTLVLASTARGRRALLRQRLVEAPGHARRREQRPGVQERVSAAGQEVQRAAAPLPATAQRAPYEAFYQVFGIHAHISVQQDAIVVNRSQREGLVGLHRRLKLEDEDG